MSRALVILAAGLGRRFGGLKQLAAVGPCAETLMDYSVYDAVQAGFDRVVFVIRPDMQPEFEARIGRRYADCVPVSYALQECDAAPGRTKPWGTGHAVLAVRAVVNVPLAVANADDFYGAGAFKAIAGFLDGLTGESGVPTYGLVTYALRDTLPPAGTVNRAMLRATPEGWLTDIVEVVGIQRDGHKGRISAPGGQSELIDGDQRVSMNLWGFTPAVFEQLERGFRDFLADNARAPDAEYYLPHAIEQCVRDGRARVKTLASNSVWCGVTHPRDTQHVSEIIRQLVERGDYPAPLWGTQ